MRVNIGTSEVQGMSRVADILDPLFEALSQKLAGEYGGPMEQLWIDFELDPQHEVNPPPRSFRFQKRVAPPRDLVDAFDLKPEFNVGHYSVRADRSMLVELEPKEIPAYAMRLLYESTQTLRGRKRTLGAFDVDSFRARFAQALGELGLE